jgi:hypothetical protein
MAIAMDDAIGSSRSRLKLAGPTPDHLALVVLVSLEDRKGARSPICDTGHTHVKQ